MSETYSDVTTQGVTGANGIDYRYREIGSGGTLPLVLLQHFRGSLDYWDPALIDELARNRRVITFDNVGVASTSGETPNSAMATARGAIAFLTALGLDRVDLLGFSIGSFVAQEMALVRPALIRRLVLAAAAPKGAPGMHGWADDVIGPIGKQDSGADEYLNVFFKPSSPASLDAGKGTLGRIFTSFKSPDVPTSWQTRNAQYDLVCSWGIPDHGALEALSAFEMPVFVTAGDSDPMILPRYSYLLAGLIPGARLKIYPDAAHGFLFQHHTEFSDDVSAFLSGD